MIINDDSVSAADLLARTGWESKPEGLCKGQLCVPAPDVVTTNGRLDVASLAETLQMPLICDPDTGLKALGPEAMGHSLSTAEAPDLVLPDLDGNQFRLSSLHGRKVLLMAWASW